MKEEKGITLVSLVIYIIVMSMVLLVMSSIINNFFDNTQQVNEDTNEIVKFNKFNTYFLKEVKSSNNKVDSISSDYILFASGNSFSISNNVIYYNNIKICDGVNDMEITLGQGGDGIDRTIINVTLNFENFNKSISYKLENIY